MRRNDPRFYLFLSLLWLGFAIFISELFVADSVMTSPRTLSAVAALVSSAYWFYRYHRARRLSELDTIEAEQLSAQGRDELPAPDRSSLP